MDVFRCVSFRTMVNHTTGGPIMQSKVLKFAMLGYEYRTWYADARKVIRTMADKNGFEYDRFCEIIAILSPRCSVIRNQRQAIHYYRTKTHLSDTIRSKRRAMDYYETTGIIRGPKTSRFSDVLKGDNNVLVLDSWMAKLLDVEPLKIGNKNVRKWVEPIFVDVANALGWALSEVQAATWCSYILSDKKNGVVPVYRDETDNVPF